MDSMKILSHRLPVKIGARVFKLETLTVETVLRILVRFQNRIDAWAEKPERTFLDLLSLPTSEAADLFALCLRPHDPDYIRRHLDEGSITMMVVLLRDTHDLARIWTSLSLPMPTGPEDPVVLDGTSIGKSGAPRPPRKSGVAVPGRSRIPSLLLIFDDIARRYSIDPHAVLSWPYESFLNFTDLRDQELRDIEVAASGLDPRLMDDSEIPIVSMDEFDKLVM